MIRYNSILISIVSFLLLIACKEKSTYVSFDTNYGEIVIQLFDETPQHKENFIKLVNEKFYDGVLFHRVIDEFMIQTGDPDSKNAQPGQMLGSGGPDYRIPAEFNDSLIHVKGAVSAARDNNPEKESSASQFYIVDGKTYNQLELKQISAQNGMNYSSSQIKEYEEIGGTPFLDKNYTVFGKVVSGLDIVERIAEVKTDRYDRPLDDIRIKTAKIVKH